MTRREIKRLKSLIEKDKQYRPIGLPISILSIAYGWFILYHQGYFVGLLQPTLEGISPGALGIPLVLFGVTKIIGMLLRIGWIRRISVIGLAFIWGGIFVINFAYAFGDGYPNPLWLFNLKIIIDCIILCTKGRFD